MKAVVMIPAGEVYDHNCVRWYNHSDIQANLYNYHNIGDGFVYDSSLKILKLDQVSTLSIVTPNEKQIERYNSGYDYILLRGSNYLNESMQWERAEEVLEKLKLPIIALGIGAQAPQSGKLKLSEQTVRIMKMISERTTSIGVRGNYTADVLNGYGIKNCRIVGCPTAFRKRDRNMVITQRPLESLRTAAFTLRREVTEYYTLDVRRYLTYQRQLLLDVVSRFDTKILAQGELEEKAMLWGTPEQRDKAIKDLKNHPWFGKWFFDDRMLSLYDKYLAYSDVVADYEQWLSSVDLALGFRLHGNLMALSNGVPAIYFTYDSRTEEFAETLRIPAVNIYLHERFDLQKTWEQDLFSGFNLRFPRIYDEMAKFLDENKIAHLL